MAAQAAVALFASLLLCACDKKPAPCAILETRLDNVIGIRQRELRQIEMREFLWNHWREKKCARLLLKSISKEGEETDASYEIKFLPASTMVMVVTVNRASYGYEGQVFWHETAKYDVYTVERVQPGNPYVLDSNSKVEILPEKATLASSDYCLRFKGWGNEVESFF